MNYALFTLRCKFDEDDAGFYDFTDGKVKCQEAEGYLLTQTLCEDPER